MAKREKAAGSIGERARPWAERIEGWRGSGRAQEQDCAGAGRADQGRKAARIVGEGS